MSSSKPYQLSLRARNDLKENALLYSMLLPLLVLLFIFCYMPLWGIVIAFQDYAAGSPMFALDGSVRWVGLKHIKRFVNSVYFERLIGNTLRLSVLELIFGFSIPIIFALLLNEVRHVRYKKFVQTASYMPYFISLVVTAGMVLSFLEIGGVINNFFVFLGVEQKEWIAYPEAYPYIYTATGIWKNFGFKSILYFSTISAIDPGLYESAKIDGANRWQQIWHITLPGIKYIIAIQLILNVGNILDSNTNLALLLYRPSTYSTADVIGTYVYREGIFGGKYSYTTAISLFMSVVGFMLTYITNRISRKLTGYAMW